MIKISKLPQSVKGIFIDRPNRFLAHIKLEQSQEIVEVHVHDPGRLKELLYPGNHVLISKAKNKNRKTKWDLLCAKKRHRMDICKLQFPQKILRSYSG